MNLRQSFDYYLHLPFLIQIGLTIQWSLYITIAVYYSILSLPNPLYDSSNAVFNGSNVHPISWVFVLLFALYIRYRTPVLYDNTTRFGRNIYAKYIYNVMLTLMLVVFAMAITELTWDFSITYYWISNDMMNGITIGNFTLTYAYFLLVMALFGCAIAGIPKRFRYLKYGLSIIVIYHVIWLAVGFPISTMAGNHFSLLPNVLELGHWSMVPVLFGVLLK
jgi:hypothetical protein